MSDGIKRRGKRLTFHVGDGAAPPDDLALQLAESPITGEAALELLGQRVLDALEPCYAMDAAGNVIFANQPFRNLQVFAHQPADDSTSVASLEAQRAGLATVDQIYRRILRDPQPVELVESAVSGEMPLRYRSHHVPVLDEGGALVGICGIYRNVGAAESNERLARSVVETQLASVEALADWTWRVDVALVLTEISEGLRISTGLEPYLFLGKALVEIGRFEGLNPGGTDALARIRERQPFRNAPFRIVSAGGTPLLFRMSGMPLFSEDNERFLGYRGTAMAVEEIADTKAAIAALEQRLEKLTGENRELDTARRDANRATEARDRFLATVSHELRTPLNAVIGFSEICTSELFGALPDPYLGYAKDIFGASSHLMELVNDLLDLARIERDELAVRCEVTDLAERVDGAAAMVSLEASRKAVDLELETNEVSSVLADPVRARQILVNLINNAVKYSGSGSQVFVHAAVADAGYAQITIRDNGPGIPDDLLGTIFEPFERASGSANDDGMGIGLYVSRRLARLMDGDISVDNAPEGGACFTVTLPIADNSTAR